MNTSTRAQAHRRDAVTVVPDLNPLEDTRPFSASERDELRHLLDAITAPVPVLRHPMDDDPFAIFDHLPTSSDRVF